MLLDKLEANSLPLDATLIRAAADLKVPPETPPRGRPGIFHHPVRRRWCFTVGGVGLLAPPHDGDSMAPEGLAGDVVVDSVVIEREVLVRVRGAEGVSWGRVEHVEGFRGG